MKFAFGNELKRYWLISFSFVIIIIYYVIQVMIIYIKIKMKNNEFYIQLSREDNFLEVDIVKPNVEENIEKVEDQVLQQADESNVKDSIFQEVQEEINEDTMELFTKVEKIDEEILLRANIY
jgi:hypothetical protein